MVVATLSSESAKPNRVSSTAISIKLQSNALVWVHSQDMKIRLALLYPRSARWWMRVLLLFALVIGHAAVGRGQALDDSVGTVQEGLKVIGQNPVDDAVHVEEGEVDDGIA